MKPSRIDMMRIRFLATNVILWLAATLAQAQEIVDKWRYTLRRPAAGWRQVNFDEDGWTKGGYGGFGTLGTPRA